MRFYCDGSCSKNPGPGGYAVVGTQDEQTFYIYKAARSEETTNNREELKSLIAVLEDIPQEDIEVIYMDSNYCVQIYNNWIYKWYNNNWRRSNNQPVENLDLIKTLYNNINKNFSRCQVEWVKGHAGKTGNEIADAYASNNEKKIEKLKQLYIIKDTDFC